MNIDHSANARDVLGQAGRLARSQELRTMLAVGALTLLGWAAIIAPGCENMYKHGKATEEHKTGAKAKMEGLKAASEYKMGEQAFFAGDLPKALKHVNYSLSLNEKVAKSYVLLGRVKMEMGDVEGATDAFVQSQKIEPRNVDAEYYQGILAERIDRREEALTHYQLACEYDPANPQYAIAAAEMMIEGGEIEKAETFLVGRANTFDHNAGIRQTLGHIELMKKNATQAAAIFQEAHLLAPDDQSITEDLIRAQVAIGKLAEAESNLARILTDKENKARRDLLSMRATCLVQLERPVEARTILLSLTAGQEGASDIEAWISLGQVCYAIRDLNHLKQAANRVTAIAPQRPEGYALRALYLRKTSQYDAAEQAISKALSLKPTAEQYVILGMIQQDRAKPDAARQSYAAALRQNPGDENAAKLLAHMDQMANVE
jgi:tetratricopeptide (TPR) repeat protein